MNPVLRPDPAQAAPCAAGLPLWPLALAASLLPLVATLLAYTLSIVQQLVPACWPMVEGCTSISRAARQGSANLLFRGLVMPAAVVQALVWLLAADWLRRWPADAEDAPRAVPLRLRLLPWLGCAAALSLLLYASFLGTEGDGYRLMRRYGVVLYFGFDAIGMLIVAGLVRDRRPGPLARALVALCVALPLLGVLHLGLPSLWSGLDAERAKDRIENITEWWAALIFTAFFALLALAWRRDGFRARLTVSSGSAQSRRG